jgi:hypothetical protein
MTAPDEPLASTPVSAPQVGEPPVAWACITCNSPRTVDPCPKCGTPLTEPAKGWEWPTLPDVARIRELAREVGYAVGVHGSLERDLDLIAVPWVAEAVNPLTLAQHIAAGFPGGRVLAFENQDKPCGRWSCNIHMHGWTKMIDLSVMTPLFTAAQVEAHLSEVLAENERVRAERDGLARELNLTREVCSLVRRQDYFDVPTPVLVEAQIEHVTWRALTDAAERVSEFRSPPGRVLARHRETRSPEVQP